MQKYHVLAFQKEETASLCRNAGQGKFFFYIKKSKKQQVLAFQKEETANFSFFKICWTWQVLAFQKESETASVNCIKEAESARISFSKRRNSNYKLYKKFGQYKYKLYKKKQKQQMSAFHPCGTRPV